MVPANQAQIKTIKEEININIIIKIRINKFQNRQCTKKIHLNCLSLWKKIHQILSRSTIIMCSSALILILHQEVTNHKPITELEVKWATTKCQTNTPNTANRINIISSQISNIIRNLIMGIKLDNHSIKWISKLREDMAVKECSKSNNMAIIIMVNNNNSNNKKITASPLNSINPWLDTVAKTTYKIKHQISTPMPIRTPIKAIIMHRIIKWTNLKTIRSIPKVYSTSHNSLCKWVLHHPIITNQWPRISIGNQTKAMIRIKDHSTISNNSSSSRIDAIRIELSNRESKFKRANTQILIQRRQVI